VLAGRPHAYVSCCRNLKLRGLLSSVLAQLTQPQAAGAGGKRKRATAFAAAAGTEHSLIWELKGAWCCAARFVCALAAAAAAARSLLCHRYCVVATAPPHLGTHARARARTHTHTHTHTVHHAVRCAARAPGVCPMDAPSRVLVLDEMQQLLAASEGPLGALLALREQVWCSGGRVCVRGAGSGGWGGCTHHPTNRQPCARHTHTHTRARVRAHTDTYTACQQTRHCPAPRSAPQAGINLSLVLVSRQHPAAHGLLALMPRVVPLPCPAYSDAELVDILAAVRQAGWQGGRVAGRQAGRRAGACDALPCVTPSVCAVRDTPPPDSPPGVATRHVVLLLLLPSAGGPAAHAGSAGRRGSRRLRCSHAAAA
jgi:hypothetical protein